MLSNSQKTQYNEKGYLVLEKQIPLTLIQPILDDLARLEHLASEMHQSDDVIDLEESHSTALPRIRRVKLPHTHMHSVAHLMRSPVILDPVVDLLGPNLRLHTSKLNMKSAGYGAAVEWHQDWAFYPHTNDDILAVGVMLDDMTEENGPLLMLPGSHRGVIYDHHNDGSFIGAIDPALINNEETVAIQAPAGSISLHHVRLVHGSDVNRSQSPRRLLLFEITCADAFPLMGSLSKLPSITEYDSRMLCGESTLQPRLVDVPVKIPMPTSEAFGSIYQLQTQSNNRAFDTID